MAVQGTYGSNFSTINGAPGSAGTDDLRVDRPNEGLPGVATVKNAGTDNYGPLTQTRGNFDTFKAIGYVSKQTAIIDTTQTNRQDLSTSVKHGNPSVW